MIRIRWVLPLGAMLLAAQLGVARAEEGADTPAPAMAAAPGAEAAQPGGGVDWQSLGGRERELLQRYEKDWPQLPPDRQRNLARGADRWLGMNGEERAQARERFRAWQDLPEDQRDLIRHRWERFQRLDPREQAAVREHFRAFRQLPPAERQMLRRRWQEATPAERGRMLERMRERRERGFGSPQH